MFKTKIAYTDFDGNSQEDSFRFNLTRAEVIRWEISQTGGIEGYLTRIIEQKNGEEIMNFFTKLIALAYGEKDDTGKHFVKSVEISERFGCSAAYDELFTSLVTNPKAAADFVKAIIPSVPPPDVLGTPRPVVPTSGGLHTRPQEVETAAKSSLPKQ